MSFSTTLLNSYGKFEDKELEFLLENFDAELRSILNRRRLNPADLRILCSYINTLIYCVTSEHILRFAVDRSKKNNGM